ncbi:YibE/F family protein [Nocardioides sp. Kera G14]|uniref:YibE/F family protein n=1 Tax=Nocardioides sp. Kera G14 TaxID=2884264 RepID=UPI001D0FF8D6|nr:YibE/F family protein [Nocardioides sp. Kera G14]UDY24851.1 YibE/F family protein [Nocardioides sp. Kera G14]
MAPVALIALLIGLTVVALATVVGLVRWWPDRAEVAKIQGSMQYAAPGVTYVDADVTRVQPRCAQALDAQPTCGQLEVTLTDGPEKGSKQLVGIAPEVAASGLKPGDSVKLIRTPAQAGQKAAYAWQDVHRGTPLWVLALLFAVAVVAVARLRGLMALVSLAIAGAIIGWWLLPSLLSGHPPLLATVAASMAIMLLILPLTHGPNARTGAALGGTVVGVLVTAVTAWLAVDATRMSGVIDDGGSILSSSVAGLSLHGVLMAAIVIAGLGALNDVTITQASAVWELHETDPAMSPWRLFDRAMRIGRDHVASTIYTLAFAYVGTGLTVLLALGLYDRPLLSLLGTEDLAEEIVRSLVGGLGLVLAMPATTALSVWLVRGSSLTSTAGRRRAH